MVTIKGMELQTDCQKCPLSCGVSREQCCSVTGEPTFRISECPLVEIITCKDCKYNNNGLCPDFRPHVSDNFYCADAKRRE